MRPCSSKSSLRRAPAASGERRPASAGAGSVVVALVFLALFIGFLALIVGIFALIVDVFALVVGVFALIVLIGFGLLDLVLVVGHLVLVIFDVGHFGLVVVRRLGPIL